MTKIINRAKGTVRFAFKESLRSLLKNPNKESLIMLHYSYGKLRFKYSTSYFSCYNNWDYKKQRIRNKIELLNRNEINSHLDELEKAVKKEVSRLDANQLPISKELLRDCLDKFTNKYVETKKDTQIDLYKFCDIFFERKKDNIADTTLRSYKQTKKLIDRYDVKYRIKTDFKNIDLDFYYDFLSFLENDDKALNTIGKHIKNLKTILNSAKDDGVNHYTAYKSKEFKVITEETTAIYLTEEEIKKIEKLDLSDNKELEISRDIFLIGYYTGQRVSDYNGLNIKDIYVNDGIKFIKIKQKKTGNVVDCPLQEEMQVIMNLRYNGEFPPKKSEQQINIDIKKIVRKAKINEPIKCVQTRGGKTITDYEPKYKLVGTHTARRSFCTNLFKKGNEPHEIMHFSGHKTVKEFYKYIRIDNEEKSLHIAKKGMFNLAS